MKDFWRKFKDFSGYPTNFQFSRTFQGRGEPRYPLHPLSPPQDFPPKESVALPTMNGPFPAELKLRKNTGVVENIKHLMTGLKGNS